MSTPTPSILQTLPTLPSSHPAYAGSMRQEAFDLFHVLPALQKKDEAWRFGDVSQADFSSYKHASAPTPKEIASICALTDDALPIIICNGRLISYPNSQDGLTVTPHAETNNKDDLFYQDPDVLGSRSFAILNRACYADGVSIRLSACTRMTRPIEIIYAVSGDDTAMFPRTVINAEPGSSADILERHISLDQGKHLCLGVQNILLQEGAELHYALAQQLSSSSKSMELGAARLHEQAQLHHLSSHPGSMWVRQEFRCSLLGREAQATLLSANDIRGNRHIDQRTYQDHRAPGARSNILYKNVLHDTAHAVFSGMIKVEVGSHDTDAYQNNRNMLLSPQAEIHALPGLEILADQVRCSHGTATSSISPEELFYLQARGIPHAQAETMIAEGFLLQVLEEFGSEPILKAITPALFGTAQ